MRKAYINGNVITIDSKNPRRQAFIVEDGKFTQVGNTEEILELVKGTDCEVRDLEGRTVVPGFNDSHTHLLNFAYSLDKVHLENLNSIDAIVDVAKKYIEEKKLPAGKWVVGCGWNHYFFEEPRFLTRDDLDRISTEHPIMFTRVCEHTVSVNSKALEELGIDDHTPDPEGGKIARDENGRATGVLQENARYIAYEKQPPKSVEEIKAMLVKAMDIFAECGLTSVQTDDFETFSDKDWTKVLKAYEELKEEGKLKVRVYEQCLLPAVDRIKKFTGAGYHTGWGDDWVKIGPLKLLVDGSIGPRSALMEEPYSDAPDTSGIAVFTQEELNELLTLGHTSGLQLACHGIGDKALRMILKGYEAAQAAKPDEDARMGIVHVQFGAPDIFENMKKNHVIGYVQPVFVQADMHCAEERVGSERIKYAYKFNTMRKMGIQCAFSSDCPIESPSPIDGIYVAATRMDYNHYPEGGWYPEEKIEVEDAIKGYTLDGAYAQFAENEKGSIENGKLADFLILSDDITKVAPETIRDITVLETYVGGERTH